MGRGEKILLKFVTVVANYRHILAYIFSEKQQSCLCCMKGEKVSTPLDKDGRGPSGLQHTYG